MGTTNNKTNKRPKLQRVQKKDAEIILKKLIDNFCSSRERAVIIDTDYADNSPDFINENIVVELIKKLTR